MNKKCNTCYVIKDEKCFRTKKSTAKETKGNIYFTPQCLHCYRSTVNANRNKNREKYNKLNRCSWERCKDATNERRKIVYEATSYKWANRYKSYKKDDEFFIKRKLWGIAYRKNNSLKSRAGTAKYRASKLRAIPLWADMCAINDFYDLCGKGFEVDHIVPLQGRNVCGLHTVENLQYLTISDNRSKGNRYDG